MASLDAPMSSAELFAKVQKVADEKGDTFRVRINRLESATTTMPPSMFALYEGATAAEIREYEIWLSALIGNARGTYLMAVYHSSDLGDVGTIRMQSSGTENISGPNLAAMDDNDWRGPKNLKAPKRPVKPAISPNDSFSIPAFDQFPAAPIHSSVPASSRLQAPGVNGAAGFSTHAGASVLPPVYAPNASADQREADIKRREDSFREALHKAELDALNRKIEASQIASAASIKDLTALIQQSLMKPAPAPTPPPRIDLGEIAALLGSVGAIMTPIITGFIDSNRASKTEAAARDAEIKKAELALREREITAQKDAMDRAMTMKDAQGEVFAQMSGAMAAMSQTAIQNAHAMVELQNATAGEAPSALERIADKVAAPLTKIAGAWLLTRNASAPAPQQFAALPASNAQQPSTERPPPMPAGSAPHPGQPGHVPPNAPPANNTPLPGVAMTLDMLDADIRKHVDARVVAQNFFKSWSMDPAPFLTELGAVDNDFDAFMIRRFGTFLTHPEHSAYADSLALELVRGAAKFGVMGKEEIASYKTHPLSKRAVERMSPAAQAAEILKDDSDDSADSADSAEEDDSADEADGVEVDDASDDVGEATEHPADDE